MSGGRKALASLIRECSAEIKACGPRSAMYDHRLQDGRCPPIGVDGVNFGSQQWHLGFAAGIQWAQMRLEWALMGSRPAGMAYPPEGSIDD
jgi:hypothetical protein